MLSLNLLLWSTFAVIATAFIVPPGTPSGIYEHTVDDSGNESMHAVNGTTLAIRSFNEAPTRRLRFEKRDQTMAWGRVTCGSTIVNDGDLNIAVARLSFYRGTNSGVVARKGAMSYVSGD